MTFLSSFRLVFWRAAQNIVGFFWFFLLAVSVGRKRGADVQDIWMNSLYSLVLLQMSLFLIFFFFMSLHLSSPASEAHPENGEITSICLH